MQKKKIHKYLWIAIAVFAALAVVLFFLNAYLPLLLLFSVFVQVPIIKGVYTSSASSSYLERAAKRRDDFEKDGDAQKWHLGEEKEARTPGFQYWSKAGRANSALNRAAALAELGMLPEAKFLLQGVELKRLRDESMENYVQLMQKLEALEAMQKTQGTPERSV